MYCARRPLFERLVRRCLADHDDVILRGDCRVTAYLTDDGATRITGVRVASGGDGDGANGTSEGELTVDLACSTVASNGSRARLTGPTTRSPDGSTTTWWRFCPDNHASDGSVETAVRLILSAVTTYRYSALRGAEILHRLPAGSISRR